jgi:hypothetical protein
MSVLPDWGQILSLIGVSALISGIVSAIVNYFMTMREFRKKSEVQLVIEKLDLYSTIIYHLDKMRFRNNALATLENNNLTADEERYAFTNEEWKELVEDIDSKIKDRYYLLDQKILEKWVWAKTLRSRPQVIGMMPELRKLLVHQYNDIIDTYVSKLTKVIPKYST